jgi:ribonucleoside-diphosphate reductase alpha chain
METEKTLNNLTKIAPYQPEKDTYTYAEAFDSSWRYYCQSELPANVFLDKYALRDSDGKYVELSPDMMHNRLAYEFARVDSNRYGFDFDERYQTYREALDNFQRLVPQGSPMAAIGNTHQKMSASNCVVISSPEDSMEGIITSGEELAQLMKRRCGVGVDISTLRPEGFRVNNAAKTTSGAWTFADFYSYITRMVCQCLHKDTKILTTDGVKCISSITPGDEVWTENYWVPVENVLQSKKRIVTVKTKFGRDISCSEDHIFHTINGEKVVKNLAIGDKISAIVGVGWQGTDIEFDIYPYERKGNNNSNRLNEGIALPTQLREEFAYVLGYSYGDGHVEPSCISLAVAPDWPGIAEKLIDYIEKETGYIACVSKGDGCGRVRVHSKLLINHLENNGMLKQKSHELVFPEKLFKAPKSVLFAFLSGYFDADGSVIKGKKCYSITSVRKEFLQDVQLCLQAWGIVSKLHELDRSKEGWRTIYTLTINGWRSQGIFRHLMRESIKIAIPHVFSKKRDLIKTCYRTSDFETKASKHSYIIDDAQWITYSTASRLCEDLGAVNEFFLVQDFVEEIHYTDIVDDVYDLVLLNTHLFYANGLYAHNSGRRGALMITMDVHHPDIEKFIVMKMDKTKVTGANVSVRYSDEFMQAVIENKEYEQRWPLEGVPVIRKMVDARRVWDLAVNCATVSAEPGCIFWDTMINFLPAHAYPQFKTASTNPCAEIALSPNDSCRLISINLTAYVMSPFTHKAYFNWSAFEFDVRLAAQMSDTLVDLELERIDDIISACSSEREKELWKKLRKAGSDGRRVGLGTHGLGDMLAQLRIKYDSDDALTFVDSMYRFFRDTTYDESVNLAIARGPFPLWDWEVEKDNAFIQRLPERLKLRIAAHGRRNIANLTNAPTGSVSMCSKTGPTFTRFGTSSGIEPIYAISQMRRKKISNSDGGARVDHTDALGDTWQEYDVFHANVANYMDLNPGITKDALPSYFVESENIDTNFRVRLQGVEQKYIDHSISSTINVPRGTKAKVVGDIYLNAWKHGLKGVTVYVDGSRDQVLHKVAEEKIDPSQRPNKIVRMEAPKRPRELDCDIHHTTIKGQKYIAVVGLMEGEPYEFFGGFTGALSIPKRYNTGKLIKKAKSKYCLHIGKNGDSIIIDDIATTLSTPEMGYVTRLISAALRHGTPIDFIVEQMTKTGKMSDFNKVIGRVLKRYIKDGQHVKSSVSCPKCGGCAMIYQEGCQSCSCGWTKCQ